MGTETKIQWCDHTFNPWRGCQKVNAGCTNCYADKTAKRMPDKFGVFGSEKQGGTRVVAAESMWREPVKWNKAAKTVWPALNRPRVFCASLADVFEDWTGPMLDHTGKRMYVNTTNGFLQASHDGMINGGYRWLTMDDCRARLFRLIDATPNLDWLLLTKRPENIIDMWPNHDGVWESKCDGPRDWDRYRDNVWLGTSVANQETAEQAIPELLKCRDLASKLFLSVEPLVGPVDLKKVGNHDGTSANLFDGNCLYVGDIGGADFAWTPRNFINWVIVGGESGPHARLCNVDWIRSVVRQCADAGVPCFVKQIGTVPTCDNVAETIRAMPIRTAVDMKLGQGGGVIQFQHPKGGNMDEWPEDLKVRQFPGSTK